MKSVLFLLGLVLFAQVTEARVEIASVASEMKLDLGNLFKNTENVDYRDYGIPDEIIKNYTIKVRYQIPLGITALDKTQFYPAERVCNITGCHNFDAHYNIEVVFSHDDFGIVYELYDDVTKKLVDTAFAPLELTFLRRQSSPVMEFYGPEEGYLKLKSGANLSVYGKGVISVGVGISRLFKTAFTVGRIERDGSFRKSYVLDKVYFRGPDVRKRFPRQGSYDFKKDGEKVSLRIGEAKYQYPTIFENFIEIKN